MKIRIDGFVRAWHWGEPNEPLVSFYFSADGDPQDNSCVIAPHTIEVNVELPDNKQLTAKIVEALREEKQRVYREANQQTALLDKKIEKLLALEAPQ